MDFVVQSTVVRETYWGITSVEYAVFYLLAFTAVAVFTYGVYQRFFRYAAGDDDSFPWLADLQTRVASATKIVLSNEK